MKATFAKGASLDDPSRLFNSSLDGNTRRAIDFHEGDTINENAFKALIRSAVALNTAWPKIGRQCRIRHGDASFRRRRHLIQLVSSSSSSPSGCWTYAAAHTASSGSNAAPKHPPIIANEQVSQANSKKSRTEAGCPT